MKGLLLWSIGALLPLSASVIGPIQIELPSINLSGTGSIPLGRASGGGYQYVESEFAISATSSGIATLKREAGGPVVQGTPWLVEIVFTGLATVTFTDVDPVHDYFGLPSSFQRAGVSFANRLSGPTQCYSDLTKPNYGCVPPVGVSFLGLEGFRVDLPVDIDGNGLLDKILLEPFRHEVDEILQRSSDSSTVTTVFRMSSELKGAVLDQENDPPFSLIATGVVTGHQSIVVAAVPEPGTYLLCGVGLTGLLAMRFRRRRAGSQLQ